MNDVIQPPVAEDGKVAEARNFLLDTRDELAKVSWPPKEELVKATKGVLVGSAMLGVALGLAAAVVAADDPLRPHLGDLAGHGCHFVHAGLGEHDAVAAVAQARHHVLPDPRRAPEDQPQHRPCWLPNLCSERDSRGPRWPGVADGALLAAADWSRARPPVRQSGFRKCRTAISTT